METISTLRCLPRRFALCFLFSCMMFLACAFYTLFTDFKDSTTISPFKFVDISDLEDDVDLKPHPLVVHRGRTPILKDDYINVQQQSDSASNKDKILNSSNIPGYEKAKRADFVTTKYIYLKNATVSAPSSSTSSIPFTTVAPPTDTCSLSMKDTKLILLWTSFFDYWDYLPKEHFRQCSRCRNCKVTHDRSRLLESDAVIFHARDLSLIDMPPTRLPHQRWIFYCLESPPYSDFSGLQHSQRMFNWTMTYRSDSDITSPYGYVSKIRPPRKLDMLNLEWAWSNKSRSVVWMSSHCPTDGGRDEFATELGKYIDVDTYGSCGTSICPPGETERCLVEFTQKYKFFLAFENSLCKDYITEKFFRTLKYDIIPVVFGGANYDKFAPPGSFIDALSFKSPKHLAFFLTGVGKNFKLYSSFFRWRKDYEVQLKNSKECQLCSMLHRKDPKQSSYENIREWWIKGSNCKTWKPNGAIHQ